MSCRRRWQGWHAKQVWFGLGLGVRISPTVPSPTLRYTPLPLALTTANAYAGVVGLR